MGSIDTAIHGAAGPELEKACEKIQRCDVGKCVVTEGYNLPCRYIIHTVSPHISEVSSAHLLAQCYKNAITEAIRMGISSVAFPLLGAGDNGFSTQKALDIALNRFEVSIRDEISELTVYLVLFHQEDLLYAKKLAGEKHLAINDCEVDDMLPENKRWISLISTCMIAYRAERVMLSASNLQFKSCLKKPESYLPIVLATVLAINV